MHNTIKGSIMQLSLFCIVITPKAGPEDHPRIRAAYGVRCSPCPDPRRRHILAYPGRAAIGLRAGPGAPPGDERARKRVIEEINRARVVQHAPHSGRRHRLVVSATPNPATVKVTGDCRQWDGGQEKAGAGLLSYGPPRK